MDSEALTVPVFSPLSFSAQLLHSEKCVFHFYQGKHNYLGSTKMQQVQGSPQKCRRGEEEAGEAWNCCAGAVDARAPDINHIPPPVPSRRRESVSCPKIHQHIRLDTRIMPRAPGMLTFWSASLLYCLHTAVGSHQGDHSMPQME